MLSQTVTEALERYKAEGVRLHGLLIERQKLLRSPCGSNRLAGHPEEADELAPAIDAVDDVVDSLTAVLTPTV